MKHWLHTSSHWTPDWRVNLLALLILPALLWLGFWQLDRAEEKRQIQALYEQRQQAKPVPIANLSQDQDLRYQPVALVGEYQPGRHILLDNKIHRGHFGYEVISAFKRADTDQWVWVNRGWIAADPTRRTLPAITDIAGPITLQGHVHVPHGKLLKLGENTNQGWPRVVQSIDIPALSEALSVAMFPFTIRLDDSQPGALQTNWAVINVQPEKHTAYAVQWFAMAGVLLIITIIANVKCR